MFRFARARVLAPLFAVLCLTAASPAFGQEDEGHGLSLHVSGGWSKLNTEGSLLDNRDGWYFDTDLSWRLTPGSPFQLGVGVSGSYYTADEFRDDPALSPMPIAVDVDMGLYTIEPRLRYVFTSNSDGTGLYVAPRIGAGLLIANYELLGEVSGPDGFLFRGENDTSFGYHVRPGLEVGVTDGRLTLGAEASYLWGWVDLGSVGDEVQELRAGVFLRIAF